MTFEWHKFSGNRTWYLYVAERYTGYYLMLGVGMYLCGTTTRHGVEIAVATLNEAQAYVEAIYVMENSDA